MIRIISFLLLLMLFTADQLSASGENSSFTPRLISASRVADNRINEASGLAASRKNPDVFWTHNDSGDSAVIFAVGSNGSAKGRFVLKNCKPSDIEDIAVGPGPEAGVSYIYLADIGDNGKKRTRKQIYRFEEPAVKPDVMWQQIKKYDVIDFQYAGQKNFDAETLLLDPVTKDLLVVSKRGKKNDTKFDQVFRLSYPQKTGSCLTAEFLCKIEIPLGFIVGYGCTGGDISGDGTQLIVKTYTNIYYWQKSSGSSFADFFIKAPVSLPYTSQEGQGEAICFTVDGCFYRTIPEESLGEAYLSLYQLKEKQKK